VQAKARAADHAGKRMMTWSPGFLRVVADGRVLLLAVAHDHGGIPIRNRIGWDRLMDHLLGGCEPSFHLLGVELIAEPAESIFSAKAAFTHTGDGGHRSIVLQPPSMRETRAAHQTIQGKSLEDVAHWGGIGTGAWNRIILGEFGNHSTAFQKVIPRDQAAIPVIASSLPRKWN
jgi:hypothetical protein